MGGPSARPGIGVYVVSPFVPPSLTRLTAAERATCYFVCVVRFLGGLTAEVACPTCTSQDVHARLHMKDAESQVAG
jgi:hypothetical protein